MERKPIQVSSTTWQIATLRSTMLGLSIGEYLEMVVRGDVDALTGRDEEIYKDLKLVHYKIKDRLDAMERLRGGK